ncbi:hypothetical protein F5148DRAFT_1205023 [Russula earlei]|uniref:Uncharacterized protein n=1 Tax=Russula earlei TaxID=71964 RepID=A0ACC0U6V2_9AGAM|nr:hypothetical protein F5148DRAFT_1205023 [Russula earlei]
MSVHLPLFLRSNCDLSYYQVTADAWAVRIPQLVRLANRHSRPVLEGVWFITMFIATFAVPAGLHAVILHSLRQKMNQVDARHEARFASVAIAIAIMLLFFGPHVVWKFMGQKRATKLVKQWESEDARRHARGAFVPVWTVKLPGYFSSSTRLIITTPYAATPSFFHPAAYMPSWINGPADSGAPNGIPATYQGVQQQAMYGHVPLYGNSDVGPGLPVPPYVGDRAHEFTDEKAGLNGART